MFLYLLSNLGASICVESNSDTDLSFLVSPKDFSEFVRLSATMEVFMRCIREARRIARDEPNTSPTEVGRLMRRDIDLPGRFSQDKRFCEIAKLAGETAHNKHRNVAIERNATHRESRHCYMCGIPLTAKGNDKSSFTVEHLWPLSFGGQTTEENLLPACKDCNNKRQHMVIWALGPVQSTFHSGNKGLAGELVISLALARLISRASQKGRRTTLRQAAKELHPLVSTIALEHGKHHLYFELLPHVRAAS